MDKFIKKNLSLISFLLIPTIFFWNPNWITILGIQPYWPLFWLLPWSMIYGPYSGLVIGLFLGLVLDSISPGSYTQIPGLIICGIWFGKINKNDNPFVEHFRHGLICSIGSFACGTLYFLQILLKHTQDTTPVIFLPSIKNILTQVFLTGLLAPIICSQLLRLFSNQRKKFKR
tara:strand:- start:175 stop:693 length:519 start_codon:yes stop_codon:yes gene_type:complete